MARSEKKLFAAIKRVVAVAFDCAFGAGVQDQLWTWLSRQPVNGDKLPGAGRQRRM
jgi:hypothetical protein